MFRIFICIFLTVMIIAGFVCSAPAQNVQSEVDLLRELTARFYDDYVNKNLDSYFSLWSPRSTDDSSKRETMTRILAQREKLKVEKLIIHNIEISGETAKVNITVHVSGVNKKDGKPTGGWMNRDVRMTHNLVKENGKWLVLRQQGTDEDEFDERYNSKIRPLAARLIEAKTEDERKKLISENRDVIDARSIGTLRSEAQKIVSGEFDLPRGYALLRVALRLAEETGDKRMIAETLDFLADLSTRVGNYPEALLNYQRSMELYKELGPEPGRTVPYYFNLFNSIGTVYAVMGDHTQALVYFLKSMEGQTVNPGNMRLTNVAATYLEMGDSPRAEEIYQKALLDLEERDKKETNSSRKSQIKWSIAGTLMGLGNVRKFGGQYAAALEFYLKALEIYQAREDVSLLYSLTRLAETHRLLGNYSESRKYTERAVPLATKLGVIEGISDSQTTLGQVYRALGQPEPARLAFDEAIKALENLRSNDLGGEAVRQRYFENKSSPYREMVDLLVSQNLHSDAFSYAERSKARVLLEVLTGERARITKSMTDAERTEERRLTSQMVDLYTQIQRESGQTEPARLDELRNLLERTRLEHEAFRTRLYAAHPELKIRRGQMQPVKVDEALNLLPNAKSALLEYVVTDDRTFLFVFTKNEGKGTTEPVLRVYPVDIKQKDVAEQVERFRQKIASRDLDFRGTARNLYDLLLKPAESQLRGKTLLTIVPDSVLWNLPFQTLLSPSGRYLIEDSAVFYSPSLTVLREMKNVQVNRLKDPEKSPKLLAFGNPFTGPQSDSGKKAVLMGESLEPLPEAEKQVRELSRLYGPKQSRVYTGAEATEERAKNEAPSYRILQFATHGVLNGVSPMYSHLVLSAKQGASDQDGRLEAWEVMDLDLRSDLVVLAACETARGRIGPGEGMIGMSWAFFVAGTPSLVASQWKVESSSTTELMLEFHRQLLAGKGITKAEALRRASVKVMKMENYRHPFYWAGFVIVGNGF